MARLRSETAAEIGARFVARRRRQQGLPPVDAGMQLSGIRDALRARVDVDRRRLHVVAKRLLARVVGEGEVGVV